MFIARVIYLFIFLSLIITPLNIHANGMKKIYKVYDYFKYTDYKEVAIIITAQMVLESAWGKSKRHNQFNNYFSIKDWKNHKCQYSPIYCMKQYDSIHDSIIDMHQYIKRKGYSKNPNGYYRSLINKGYAEDPRYVIKLKSIVKRLQNIL